MLKALCWVIAFFVPLNCSAFSGTITMHNIIFTQYKLTHNTQTQLYTIKAQQQREYVPDNKKTLLLALNNKKQAQELFHYKNGILIIDPLIKIYFGVGYYYRGNFIMENVRGKINTYNISTKELTFNIHKKQFITSFFVINDHGIIISKVMRHHQFI
ncbi:hypothetical protein [Photobacterium carnosum]|uniref:hypothetical protein n=1 Tax=Photobacterium carnosum TaxID=2023717 RepID=UPI00243322C4|nr:hypothetical protein [Photobacterium carnosum]